MPRRRGPWGEGVRRIHTVRSKKKKKREEEEEEGKLSRTRQHKHDTQTALRRTETQCITRKNEKAHIHTRDMTQPEERDNNNTEAHQTTT